MSWDVFIGIAKDTLTLTALAGATYSAIEFVRSAISSRDVRRAAEVGRWRKASVQKIIANSVDFLSVEEITSSLRSQSFDAPVDIKRDELTIGAVRQLLMEMVTERVVGQVWPDRYGLEQIKRDITLAATVEGLKGNIAVRAAFALIHKHPGRYTDEELFGELGPNLGISLPDFVLAMSDLEPRNVAKKGPNSKWVTASNKIEKN